MRLLPSIKVVQCPCCSSLNVIKVNGITYENNYKSLEGFVLKKIFNCRKCKEQLGLFYKDSNNGVKNFNKVFWLEDVLCNDKYYTTMKKLEDIKVKNIKFKNKKYYETLDEINEIQNKIRNDKIKLKIKLKIQKKGVLIRHVY